MASPNKKPKKKDNRWIGETLPIMLFQVSCVGSVFTLLYMGVKARKRSWIIQFFIALALLAASLASGNDNFWTAAFLGVGVYSLVFIAMNVKEFIDRTGLESSGTQKQPPTPQAASDKGTQMIADLLKWKGEIESQSLRGDIDQIVSLSKIVLQKSGAETDLFFSRYDAVLNKLLHKYDEIENTRLDTEEMAKTMKLIADGICDIAKAMRQDVNNMYKQDLLDINAETSVFLRELQKKGLLEP